MLKELQNYFVVIRSAGERTLPLCKKLIRDQGVSENDLVVVREVPFSRALKKSFEAGLSAGKKWTFCVDADVLIRMNCVEHMIKLSEKQPKNVCMVQGYILDKFFGGIRRGGIHVYRTSSLNKCILKIPDEGTDIRPESFILGEMEKDGYPHKIVPYIVGTHDDEQYYYDIYRKAFVQAVKHTSRSGLFIDLWRANANKDIDFKVALRGFADSITHLDSVFINKDHKLFKQKFAATGFREKEELNIHSYTSKTIESIIQTWSFSDTYFRYFPNKDGYEHKLRGSVRTFRRVQKKFGLYATVKSGIRKLFHT